MRPRSELHTILLALLGSNNVYFQPPPTLSMNYPCIVYRRDSADTDYSNNQLYKHMQRYLVTVIDKNPDSVFPNKVAQLPFCQYDRFYSADNLNHDVFKLFF